MSKSLNELINARTCTRERWLRGYSKARKLRRDGKWPAAHVYGAAGGISDRPRTKAAEPTASPAVSIYRRGDHKWLMPAVRAFLDPELRAAIIGGIDATRSSYIAQRDLAELASWDAAASPMPERTWDCNGGRGAYGLQMYYEDVLAGRCAVRDFVALSNIDRMCSVLRIPEVQKAAELRA